MLPKIWVGTFLVLKVQSREKDVEVILMVKWKLDIP